MTTDRVARRYPASSFPEIKGVQLVPPGAAATLVNLSATGVLVECESRLLPGAELTVEFAGKFRPASTQSRVIRCEVIGIATNGSLRYRIGLAFSARISLPNDNDAASDDTGARGAASAVPPPATAGDEKAAAPVLRNRW